MIYIIYKVIYKRLLLASLKKGTNAIHHVKVVSELYN
jgi:flagellin-specific chaperone FliS